MNGMLVSTSTCDRKMGEIVQVILSSTLYVTDILEET